MLPIICNRIVSGTTESATSYCINSYLPRGMPWRISAGGSSKILDLREVLVSTLRTSHLLLGWWCWLTIVNADVVVVVYDTEWWYRMMIQNDDTEWWCWLTALIVALPRLTLPPQCFLILSNSSSFGFHLCDSCLKRKKNVLIRLLIAHFFIPFT